MNSSRQMTRDEALDFASMQYLAENVDEQVGWDDSNEEIARVLAPWNIEIITKEQ